MDIINRKKPRPETLVGAEYDAEIRNKDGVLIPGKVQVFDTPEAYGADDESVAQMMGDTADRATGDSEAGEKAYEAALEQLDHDPATRRLDLLTGMYKAKRPMMDVWVEEDAAGVMRGLWVHTVWGRSPWDPELKSRIDYVPLDEMDRVELEKLYGVKTVRGT